jgi:hypothetical protein
MMDTSQLNRLVEMLSEKSYSEGDRILRQGDLGESFYIITEGGARCAVKRPGAAAEKEVLQLVLYTIYYTLYSLYYTR